MFLWYHSNGDGSASVHFDTPAIRDRVDTERGWFGSPEGAIKNGGVIATAFKKKTEETYDARAWLERDEMVSTGSVTITTITAEPACPGPRVGAV